MATDTQWREGALRSFRSKFAPVLLLAAVAAAAAEPGRNAPTDLTQLSIEDLLSIEVYSASKFVQKTSEAPAAVSVITAADIKSYGYRTLADILGSARGLFITNDRNYQYVGVRGFNRPGDYNSRILLQVDGYRVNDANYDTASIGQEFFLDVDLIDRVEIVRGPGSSIYGSNAFFGVVNVITRRGRDFGGAEAAAEVASFGTTKERLTYGKQYENGTELLLSATHRSSQGQDLFFPEFNTPAGNNGVARGLDKDVARQVYGKLSFGGFMLTTAYAERSKGVPTASFGSLFNDPRTQTQDSQAVFDFGYHGPLSERVDVSARAYYGRYFYDGTFPYDSPPVTVNKDMAWAEWRGAEVKLAARYDGHKLVAGAEYQDNNRQDQKNFDLVPSAIYIDERHRSQRQALYVQDEMTLGRGLLLNAGLRYDNYSTVGHTYNPRLALIYSPQAVTALKFLYGTAFRAPNAFELYYADATTVKAPQSLKPEKIASYEFVVEHQLQPNFRLTGAVYRNEIRNLISQVVDTDGLAVFRNTGLVEAKGAEFEAERAWSDDTRLRASYAWQVTRDQASGTELENSPRHLAKLNYSRPLFGDALRAGAELQYLSRRKTLANGNAVAGYAIANLTLLARRLAPGLELSASAYNLFDRRHADPGRPEHVEDAIAQDGRSLRLKLSYRF